MRITQGKQDFGFSVLFQCISHLLFRPKGMSIVQPQLLTIMYRLRSWFHQLFPEDDSPESQADVPALGNYSVFYE